MGMMTAKNTFGDGLLMDFAPDNTQATCLSNALNATLVTMNGNELSLQNDMGNGRVETALLPEGYIPVGTCEFGGIIYIASYNPLTNKSLIGCFPSPERNISSTEVNEGINISNEFLEIVNNEITGKLNSLSVKKVLLKEDLRAGDKYIIYLDNLETTYLSDYGTQQHGVFPKLIKIHIVSIEDSGKITYLDSTTKWYDDYYIAKNKQDASDKIDIDSYRNMLNSGYSIFSSKVSGKLSLLIELEKIDSFDCTWESYNIGSYTKNNIEYTKYAIYLNTNWKASNKNINPKYIVLTESSINDNTYRLYKFNEENKTAVLNDSYESYKDIPIAYSTSTSNYWYADVSRTYKQEDNITYKQFIENYDYETVKKDYNIYYKVILSKDENALPELGKYYCNTLYYYDGKYYTVDENNNYKEIVPIAINDDIVNNKFNYPVTKKLGEFEVPTKLIFGDISVSPDITNFIYKYTIAPAMPYGILSNLQINGFIDFKKIGTKNIELNTWKYYNYENTSTFTFGLNAYTENNKGIKEILIEFYDNSGIAAVYHSGNKPSFNGQFTEYFTLNEVNSNYKISNVGIDNKVFTHKGVEIKDSEGNITYTDDAGILYSNCLYLAKIIVEYCSIDSLGNYINPEKIEFTRWYWTNTMYNEYYYNTLDFIDLPFELNLDCSATYKTNNYNVKTGTYKAVDNFKDTINNGNIYKSLSANVQYVNLEGGNNISMSLDAGLLKDYNTFQLNAKFINNFICKVYLGKLYIENTLAVTKCSSENIEVSDIILPINDTTFKGTVDSSTSKTLNSLVGSSVVGNGDELSDNVDAYKNYKNTCNVSFSNATNTKETISYIGYDKEDVNSSFDVYTTTLKEIYGNNTLSLSLKAIHYSKYYYTSKLDTNANPILKAFVASYKDLANYNLTSYSLNNSFVIGFNKMYFCAETDLGGNNCLLNAAVATFSNYDKIKSQEYSHDSIGTERNVTLAELINYRNDYITDNFHFLFPFGFANSWGDHKEAKVYYNDKPTITVAQHVTIGSKSWTGEVAPWSLGGTLGAVLNTGNVEVYDEFIEASASSGLSVNALTRFTPKVLGFLTLLFYLSDETLDTAVCYPNNYIYLDDNTMTYTRDVVVNVKAESDSDFNSYVLFRKTMDFGEYINAVIKLATPKNMNMSNVTVILKECIKNLPIQAQFNYIRPAMDILNNNTSVIVKSIYDDIPTIVNKTFNTDTVYGYDKGSKEFVPVRDISKLYECNNYDTNGQTLTSSLSDNRNEFSINKVNKRLITDGKYLCFNSVPTTSSTYKVSTHNKYRITGFKKDLHFYGN